MIAKDVLIAGRRPAAEIEHLIIGLAPGRSEPGCLHAEPIISGYLEVVRLLLERGADPSIRDDLFQIYADGWLHMSHAAHPHDPVTQQIHDLIEPRSH